MSDTVAPVEQGHMREFWNRRAREEAYFFVDDRRAYGDPELESFWAEGERDLGRLLEFLEVEIKPTDTVLDIGCGVGRLSRVIAGRAARVCGLDISSEMIDRAREHHASLANIEWIVGDGTSLRPLPDGSVDGCVSHVVFQHIPDPSITLGYIAEMGRVLRPGGWAAFHVSGDAHIHRRRRGARAELRRLAAMLGRAPRGQADPAWLGSAVELEDVREVARRSGLELERVLGEGTQFCLIRARKR
ncbi:MAG: class I SAM-dependent methyltransferase [Actinomycetota bacterium]|nr:class I SAM-dependent methyltransferase [Actinomycetota bacterium]